jgi:type IV pilus assembly protein PilC
MMGRLQALLDPFLIVILGVVVGFIAVAMLLPMFDVITKVGNADAFSVKIARFR